MEHYCQFISSDGPGLDDVQHYGTPGTPSEADMCGKPAKFSWNYGCDCESETEEYYERTDTKFEHRRDCIGDLTVSLCAEHYDLENAHVRTILQDAGLL